MLEGLIQIGQREQAFKLIEKCDFQKVKKDKQIMSLYINLLSEKDLAKAAKIAKELAFPSAIDL